MKNIDNPNRLKIVFTSHDSNLQGAPRSLLLFLEYLNRDEVDPIVFIFGRGEFIDRIKEMNIPYRIFHKSAVDINILKRNKICAILKAILSLPIIEYPFKIFQVVNMIILLARLRPDIVYVNTIARSRPVIAAKILNIPIIVHVRESGKPFNNNTIEQKLRLYCISSFPNKFICVSNSAKSSLIKYVRGAKKISIVYNGVDVDDFSETLEDRSIIRNELQIHNNDILIGFIGRLSIAKGIIEFLHIAKMVSSKNNHSKFVIVGDPKKKILREKIMPLISKYKMNEYITIRAFDENIKPYYSAMDIFAMTSKNEAFARVNLEAMSMSKPIVAFDVGGNREAIRNGETGFLVPPSDIDSFADRILALTYDASMRKQFGIKGRKHAKEHFTVHKYQNAVMREISTLLESR